HVGADPRALVARAVPLIGLDLDRPWAAALVLVVGAALAAFTRRASPRAAVRAVLVLLVALSAGRTLARRCRRPRHECHRARRARRSRSLEGREVALEQALASCAADLDPRRDRVIGIAFGAAPRRTAGPLPAGQASRAARECFRAAVDPSSTDLAAALRSALE